MELNNNLKGNEVTNGKRGGLKVDQVSLQAIHSEIFKKSVADPSCERAKTTQLRLFIWVYDFST
jgi:hypothetical protein